MIRIAIADDHDLFREGIRAILERSEEIAVVLTAGSGTELLEKLNTSETPPQIILMDLNMPELNGIESTQQVLKAFPELKVVALTMHNEDRYILRMIELGASGYLQKSAKPHEMIQCLKEVAEKGFYFSEGIARIMQKGLMKREHLSNSVGIPVNLSDRELEVLRLICRERTSQEIADELHLSIRTVEGHRKNLLGKTGVKTVAGLVVFGFKHNLIEIEE